MKLLRDWSWLALVAAIALIIYDCAAGHPEREQVLVVDKDYTPGHTTHYAAEYQDGHLVRNAHTEYTPPRYYLVVRFRSGEETTISTNAYGYQYSGVDSFINYSCRRGALSHTRWFDGYYP